MERILNIGFIKRDGKMHYLKKEDNYLFDRAVEQIREGQKVFAVFDFNSDNGRLSQISKLKAGTRELARETGETFAEVEKLIKTRAGLCRESGECKSFADCSISELSDAIQVMIEIGDFTGMNLR